MAMQDLFGDQQLDADLAMILNLQGVDPRATVGPSRSSSEDKKPSVHQSHTASVTIAVALGLFVIASSALLLRNRVPTIETRPTSVSPSLHRAVDTRPALLAYPDQGTTQGSSPVETADVSDQRPSLAVHGPKPHSHGVRWASNRLNTARTSSPPSPDGNGGSVTDVAQPSETLAGPSFPALADALPPPALPGPAISDSEKMVPTDDVVRKERRRDSIAAIRSLRRQ